MVRRKSLKAEELDIQVTEAVLGIQSGKYKSPYEAGKVLGLCRRTILRRVQGGLTRKQARTKQQLLSKTQEETILKWIKELTISGYAPSHRILREVADEIRASRNRVFNPTQHQPFQPDSIPNFPLGQDWVPRFIQRHPQLKVQLGRRIEAQRMSGVTKEVLKAWFNVSRGVKSRMA